MSPSFAASDKFTASAFAPVDSARSLQLLSQCSRAIIRIPEEQALLAEICRIAVEVGGYRMAWMGCTRAGDVHIKPCAHAGHAASFLTNGSASWAPLPAGAPRPVGEALRTGQVQCDASSLALPLVHGEEVLGVLVLSSQAAQAVVTDAEIALLQEVADNLAFSLKGLRQRRARAHLEHGVVQALASLSGPADSIFLQRMVRNLAQAVGCEGVALYRLSPDSVACGRLLAGVLEGSAVEPVTLDWKDSPCEHLLAASSLHRVGPLAKLYPKHPLLATSLQACESVTFLGHRLQNASGHVIGSLCVVFKKAPQELDLICSTLQVFAARAATELECMDANQEIHRLNASLEERVEHRTAQLKQANEDWASFCYAVSHDLRTPLSAVDGFAHLLGQALEKSDGPAAEKTRHYLSRIRAGMLHMGELIEALLQLARLARTPMVSTSVDLSRLAEAILLTWREREPSRAVQLDIDPGLCAMGDARLLRQMMENLLGNAWKFSGGQALTYIRFARAAERDLAPDEPVFVVEDKGAGFNMAYAQNLFGPFQRLHSPSEFEGTGIGLATVQRIVHRHGGRVWGEAEPGLGARFYFSLGRVAQVRPPTN